MKGKFKAQLKSISKKTTERFDKKQKIEAERNNGFVWVSKNKREKKT